jgi:hypothetical protein
MLWMLSQINSPVSALMQTVLSASVLVSGFDRQTMYNLPFMTTGVDRVAHSSLRHSKFSPSNENVVGSPFSTDWPFC